MSFDEIAKQLGISKAEAIRIYESAMRKLKMPSEKNKKFWNYVNISEHPENKE